MDEQNNIILSGELADGTYTIKYEDEDGTVTEIGTLNHCYVPEPTYTNVLPLAINSDGSAYNGGQGWKSGTRLNSSGAESTSNATEIEVTGFIPVKYGDKVYLGDITMNNGTYADKTYAWLYDANFTKMDGRYRLFSQYNDEAQTAHVNQGLLALDSNKNVTMLSISGSNGTFYTGINLADMSNVAYLRISCEHIDGNSIITVNEPIV